MSEYKQERRLSMKEHQDEAAREGKPVWVRFFMTIVFLGSVAMCVQQTHVLVVRYLSKPLETEIKMTVNDVMQFPAVTVCNMNPMLRSRWNKKIEELEKAEGKQQQQPFTGTQNHNRTKRKANSYHLLSKVNKNDGILVPDSSNRLEDDEIMGNFQRDKDSRKLRSRTKRQNWSLYMEIARVKNLVRENQKDIEKLNGTISELVTITDTVLNTTAVKLEFSKIITELENITSLPLEMSTNDLEGRLKHVESNITAFMGGMEATKRYLKFLQANLTWTVNVTETKLENKTSENIGVTEKPKKLPLSKDMEAFNDYLENVGKMAKEDIRTLGHQKEDFIAICTWKGSICNTGHFVAFQDVLYGNCFTFNTSQIDSSVKETGPRNGLSLSLYIEQNEYLDRVAPAAGARVVIHNANKEPFPEDQGFTVAAGQTTSIYLRKSTSEAVEPMCDPKVEDKAYSYEENGKIYQYSQKACINQCLFNETLRQCHCVGRQFVVDSISGRCSQNNQEQEQCVQRLESLAKRNELPCSCPATCRTTTYNPMISSAIWPAEQYISSFIEELARVQHKVISSMENVSDISQFFSDNFLRVDIFFNALTEQKTMQRRSYDFKRLISDIGGQLGLWIGVSVATLCEVISGVSAFATFLIKYCKSKVRRTKKLRSLSIPQSTNVGRSYQVASTNSLMAAPPHWSLDATGSHVTSRFLRVHFEMDDDHNDAIHVTHKC